VSAAKITQARLKELLDYDPETGVFTWKFQKTSAVKAGGVAGTLGTNGYWCIKIDRKRWLAHRLAWLFVYSKFPDGNLDHRDRDRLNNAITNLRRASVSQNTSNTERLQNNETGYRGVYKSGRISWMARIVVGGKRLYGGSFRTAKLAAKKYDEMASTYFGEFARLNFSASP